MVKITGALHDDVCTFMIIARSSLLRMKHVSDKIFSENQDTFYDPELFHENHAAYEIM
jgi:hypothetical protein